MMKEIMGNVETINDLIREQMDDVSTLDDLVDLVYAGSGTVCEIHGTLPTVEREEREGNTAPWKVRLERKIVKMRKNWYYTYLPQCCCTIQETEGTEVASEFRIRAKDQSFDSKMKVICDRLKQKV
ncbi:hypothetical protein HHI36_016565 [Cryptolaemus montrouzieri]|uniref:Uncharacterized protein n=1 Tax=Cryptolaemus montrouzieri TaxID=559131 RepID=A0ABD2NKW1_9CUCU